MAQNLKIKSYLQGAREKINASNRGTCFDAGAQVLLPALHGPPSTTRSDAPAPSQTQSLSTSGHDPETKIVFSNAQKTQVRLKEGQMVAGASYELSRFFLGAKAYVPSQNPEFLFSWAVLAASLDWP